MHFALLYASVTGTNRAPAAGASPASVPSIVPMGGSNRGTLRCAGLQTEIRPMVKVVGLPGNHRRDFEIFRGRRRRRPPLEPRGRPRIRSRYFAVKGRPGEINHRQEIAESEN